MSVDCGDWRVKVLLVDKLTFQIVPKTTSALLLVTIGKGKPT